MYTKAKFNNRRRWQGKEEKKIVCYNYRKPEHVIVDCPDTKSKPLPPRSSTKKGLEGNMGFRERLRKRGEHD